ERVLARCQRATERAPIDEPDVWGPVPRMELTRDRVHGQRLAIESDRRDNRRLKLLAQCFCCVRIGWIDCLGVTEANDDPFARGGLPAGPKRSHPADVRAPRVGRAHVATWKRRSKRYQVAGRRSQDALRGSD